MKRRNAIGLIVAAPLALKLSTTVAGGMAVVYLLGERPRIYAGIPFRLRFAVLGHDMIDHLWNGFDCEISLVPMNGGHPVTYTVPGKGGTATAIGAYETEITVTEPGSYTWSIRPGSWEPTYFPTLMVYDSDTQATPTAGDNSVEIGPDGFHPPIVKIPAGGTVTWRNLDSMSSHQITWKDAALDDSPPFPVHGEFTARFDMAGEFDYFCGPHPHMTGTVVVTAF